MTATTPVTPGFSGTGSILNPATGGVAGEVRWTDPADYRPRPVVGIIAPWNYPVANALMDAIGALAAGCAVLLKPSERRPLTAEVLRRGWRESGGPDVFALAQGAREVSEAVIDNADFVQFTGSSATWMALARPRRSAK